MKAKVALKRIVFAVIWMLSIASYGQDLLLFESENLPSTDTVWVFVPSNYSPKQPLPVVYMLHGYGSDFRQWHQIMDAQQYADSYNMIIVCPDAFKNAWYFNSPRIPESQYADFFFGELLPQIEKTYSIDPQNRFITGLSMGGHGALHLFLKRPDLFRNAGSSSGVLDLRSSAGLFELNDHLGSLKENTDLWLSLSAIGNLNEFKSIGKELIIDCGTEDPFHKWNKLFFENCQDKEIPLTFISQPGKHDWDYWKKSIKAHFEFFKKQLDK